ncbi:MAG TPA: methyltransferase [Caulobacteraceae bacterium]|jgi:predicted methyltransferase|nr:methyltransferase [Caulobacteraceae bacterium]
MQNLKRTAALAAGLVMAFTVTAASAQPASITAAVADPARPAAHVARDPFRKPVDMMVFAKVKPGDHVLELIPGGGYFERIFSVAVGPNGHLFEAIPSLGAADASPKSNGVAADPHYGNITEISMNAGRDIAEHAPYDLIWTSQNYHDLHLTRLHLDIAALDAALFNALKPGGVMVIVDHAAEPGSGTRDTDKMHRIDEDLVKKEMKAAGFVLEDESLVLRNPADAHTLLVFDPAIRGHTDQFVLRFRKPLS